jgi:hypothetical protein
MACLLTRSGRARALRVSTELSQAAGLETQAVGLETEAVRGDGGEGGHERAVAGGRCVDARGRDGSRPSRLPTPGFVLLVGQDLAECRGDGAIGVRDRTAWVSAARSTQC